MDPVSETLSSACSKVLKMSVDQLAEFKPQTIAEKIAMDYAFRAGRGDDNAFNMLVTTADTCVIDQSFEDDLSKALEELGRDLVSDYRERQS